MDEQIVEKSKSADTAKAPAAAPDNPHRDLSEEIAQTVEREPRDRVKCVRLFDDFYRCNWWAPDGGEHAPRERAEWAEVATNRVRKSQFLRATLHEGKLRIKPVPVPAANA